MRTFTIYTLSTSARERAIDDYIESTYNSIGGQGLGWSDEKMAAFQADRKNLADELNEVGMFNEEGELLYNPIDEEPLEHYEGEWLDFTIIFTDGNSLDNFEQVTGRNLDEASKRVLGEHSYQNDVEAYFIGAFGGHPSCLTWEA